MFAALTDVSALILRHESRSRGRSTPRNILSRCRLIAFLLASILALGARLQAQSTFGTVLGTLRDPSGGVVPNAKLSLINTGTNGTRTALSNASGSYEFVNVDKGNYQLKVEAVGFQNEEFQPFDLDARATVRLDVALKVVSQVTSVNVEELVVLQTDASNIAETKGALELTDLPVAIGTRSTGSTSAFSTLTAQPGVQIDNNNNISVAGALPSQLSFSLDGISSVGPGTLGALTELFPSFNSIAEIKISENLNPAEFGGVADVTTISKSGSNGFHGGLFENFQNAEMNAADTFSHIVTPVKLNDFGAFLGGPVVLPKLYNGHDKTFFFGSYEVLRLPKSFQIVESVPSAAMRSGDLTAYNASLGLPPGVIPQSQINPYSQKLMNFFYPMPNYGPPGAIANNYLAVFNTPINSAQGDVRLDHVINAKHSLFVRYSYKDKRRTDFPKDPLGNPGSPSVGVTSLPEVYNSLTAAWNWLVSPTKVNELRIGFTKTHRGFTTGYTAEQAASVLGLTTGSNGLPGPLPPGNDTPTLTISGYLGSRRQTADINPREGTWQALDTFTWTRGQHTLKFGGDFRYLESLFTNVFSDYRMGSYQFNGSATGYSPFQGFLLGYPDLTTIATVINPATDAYSFHYAAFAQDDWKVSRSLTVNYGLRWEYHPGFRDWNDNTANFDPYYSSTIDGQLVKGAVIIPDKASFVNVNPQFIQSVAPTPVITAGQAGVPPALRFSSTKDFAPRIGFAWRIGGDNKTVLRGGYGRFIETLLSASAINGWSVGASDVGFFSNSIGDNGLPVFSLPYSFPSNIAQPGTQFFDLANEIK